MLFDLVGVKTNDPLPAKQFQLLHQFLQVKVALSPQTAPTLNNLLAALKQPADQHEQQQLTDYCQTRFHCNNSVPLTHAQMSDVIHQLFARRLEKAGHTAPTQGNDHPIQPLLNPLIAALPQSLQKVLNKPTALIIVLIIIGCLLALIF
ncbi:Flagellar regulator flk [compost metagenome]